MAGDSPRVTLLAVETPIQHGLTAPQSERAGEMAMHGWTRRLMVVAGATIAMVGGTIGHSSAQTVGRTDRVGQSAQPSEEGGVAELVTAITNRATETYTQLTDEWASMAQKLLPIGLMGRDGLHGPGTVH
jgi:hypothetical protein